jgi:O-antigen/teichoic acid export membrane protein
MAIPAAVTFVYSARMARRLATSATNLSNPRPSNPFPNPNALKSVFPIGAGIVLSALYFRVDVFLVQAWQGTTAVALYNAVFRLVDALRLFPAAVLAVALPVLCRATTRHALMKLSVLLTVAAAAVSLALWVGAGMLIPLLYGGRYAGAVPAFRILLGAFPLMSLNLALTHQLIGWHGHRAYAAMCAAALAFNIVLNVELIPSMGIAGAAWSTVATELVITLGCVIALARITNLEAFTNLSNASVRTAALS